MTNDGTTLERTIAAIERVLSGQDCTIEQRSRRLRDRETGKVREHDVLIMRDYGHYSTIVALECRDRSRKVTVPEIEAFAQKCSSTGVNLGVVVSTKGFWSTAKTKARALGIICAQLGDIEEADWLDPEFKVVVFERNFGPCDAVVMFKGENPESLAEIRDTNGQAVSAETIARIVAHNVPFRDNPAELVGKTVPVRMTLNTIDWQVSDEEGKIFNVDHIVATTDYTYVAKTPAVQLHSYETDDKRYVFAHHELRIGEHEGHIVMLEEDDSVKLFWTKDKNPST